MSDKKPARWRITIVVEEAVRALTHTAAPPHEDELSSVIARLQENVDKLSAGGPPYADERKWRTVMEDALALLRRRPAAPVAEVDDDYHSIAAEDDPESSRILFDANELNEARREGYSAGIAAERGRIREAVENLTVLIQIEPITNESSVRYLKLAAVLAIIDSTTAPHTVQVSPSGPFYWCTNGLRHSYHGPHELKCCLCSEPLTAPQPAAEQEER